MKLSTRVLLAVILIIVLLGAGCVVFTIRNAIVYNGLCECAKSDDTACIQKWINLGADVNSVDPETKTTALMAAVDARNLAAVKILVEHGANVNAKEYYNGRTALSMAYYSEIQRYLIAHGAN